MPLFIHRIHSDYSPMRLDLHWRSIWRSVQPHLPRPARRPNRHRDRCYAFRLDPPVDHAPLLEGTPFVSTMRLRVVQRDPADDHESAQSGLLLDQSWSAVVRMVRQSALAAGDRAGRTGRGNGTVPGHAHVHHERLAADGHEGGRTAAGTWFAAPKGIDFHSSTFETKPNEFLCCLGETRLDNWSEDAHERRPTELGQSVQTGAGPEEGQGDGVLLWTAAAGQDAALQMWSVRVRLQEGDFLSRLKSAYKSVV